jgi:hypothetical protein
MGITISGLNEMEHNGFSSALIKGILTSFHKIENLPPLAGKNKKVARKNQIILMGEMGKEIRRMHFSEEDIFKIKSDEEFQSLALEMYRFHYENNPFTGLFPLH